jgi:TPR repeat protein
MPVQLVAQSAETDSYADVPAASQTALGAAYLWGSGVARDRAQARTLLEAAAGAGSAAAQATLGEALIAGVLKPAEPQEGQRLLEMAIVGGNTDAMVALGTFLLYGRDLPRDLDRAEALFEQAAEAGNGQGIEELGGFLMWSRRDWTKAEALLSRAGEMGRGSAWSTLAEGAMYGYLGAGNRDRFDEFAKRARAAGSDRIPVLESERLQWGISQRASGPKALATLEEAAESGNATALKALVSLTRDGNDYNVRKRPDDARAHLARHGDLLTAEERAYYTFSIDAALSRQRRDLAGLAQRFAGGDWEMTKALAEDLYAANPNLVIFMIQRDLAERGIYGGPINGLATRTTIRALFQGCRDLAYDRDCREDVLSPGVIADLFLG